MLGCPKCCNPCAIPCNRLVDLAGSFTFDNAGSGATAEFENYVDELNVRHTKVTVTMPNTLPSTLKVFYCFLKLVKPPPMNWLEARMEWANEVTVNDVRKIYDIRGAFHFFNNVDNKWYINTSMLGANGELGGIAFEATKGGWKQFDDLPDAISGVGFGYTTIGTIPLDDTSDTDVYVMLAFRVNQELQVEDQYNPGDVVVCDLRYICDTYNGTGGYPDECTWKTDTASSDIFHRFTFNYSPTNGDHNNPNYGTLTCSRSFGTPGGSTVLCKETLSLFPYTTYTDDDLEETYQIFRSDEYESLNGEMVYMWAKLQKCIYYQDSKPRFWISIEDDDYEEPESCTGTVASQFRPIWDNILNADSATHDPFNLVAPLNMIIENFSYLSSTSNTRFRGSEFFPKNWFSTPKYIEIRNCDFFPSGNIDLKFTGASPPALYSSCATNLGGTSWLIQNLDLTNVSCQPYTWGTVDAGTLYPRYTNRFTATGTPMEIGDSDFRCNGELAGTGLTALHVDLFLTETATQGAYLQQTPPVGPVLNCGAPGSTNCSDSSWGPPCDSILPKCYFDLCWVMSGSTFQRFAIRMVVPSSTFIGQSVLVLGQYDLGSTLTDDWQTQGTKVIGNLTFHDAAGTSDLIYEITNLELGTFEYRIVREDVF